MSNQIPTAIITLGTFPSRPKTSRRLIVSSLPTISWSFTGLYFSTLWKIIIIDVDFGNVTYITNSIKIVLDTTVRNILLPWLFVVRVTTGLCCNWGFVDFHFLISHLSRVEWNIFAFRSRFILSKTFGRLRPWISFYYKENVFIDNSITIFFYL